MMNHPTFKLTVLGVLTLALQQFAFADSPTRQTLPQFQAEDIPTLCDAKIKDIQRQLTQFEAKPMTAQNNAAPVLAEWDRIFASFEDFYGPIGLYSNVSPDAALRKAAEDCEIKISQFQTDIYQNPKLYQQIKSTQAKDAIDSKFREDLLNDFEKTGIQLSAEKQARLKVILAELAKIEQEYARNVRDNPQKLEFTSDELKGLPQSYIDASVIR
jgi:thimet oligopeptidase